MIRFDGLYVTLPKRLEDGSLVVFDYLRFYADGWVIHCVSTGTPREVIRWFDRGNPAQSHLLKGRYNIQGNEISFSPEFRDYDEGEEIVMRAEYRGRIEDGGETLNLVATSQVDGSEHPGVFRFVQVDESER